MHNDSQKFVNNILRPKLSGQQTLPVANAWYLFSKCSKSPTYRFFEYFPNTFRKQSGQQTQAIEPIHLIKVKSWINWQTRHSELEIAGDLSKHLPSSQLNRSVDFEACVPKASDIQTQRRSAITSAGKTEKRYICQMELFAKTFYAK